MSFQIGSYKNYETVSKFVNVMQRKLWTLFAGLGV